MWTPGKKHQFWKNAAPKQIKLRIKLVPFEKIKLPQIGPIETELFKLKTHLILNATNLELVAHFIQAQYFYKVDSFFSGVCALMS